MIIANREGPKAGRKGNGVRRLSKGDKSEKSKQASAEGVEKIIICSDVDVRMFSGNTNIVEAYLYSRSADVDGDVFIKRESDKLRISTQILNRYGMPASAHERSKYFKCDGANGMLVLYVQIPERVFEKISVKSDYGSITMTSFLKAETIKCQCENGSIAVAGMFANLKVDTKSGNISIDSKIKCDVVMDVISKNGNIDVNLQNVSAVNLSCFSQNGSCRNLLKLTDTGYTVSGYMNTQNGAIKIK